MVKVATPWPGSLEVTAPSSAVTEVPTIIQNLEM